MNCFYVFDTEDFNERYAYKKDDLGCNWSKRNTVFKLWAPMADECRVVLYADGHLGGPIRSFNMDYGESGVWTCEIEGNFNGYYYNFSVRYGGDWSEVVDPYVKTTGVNGIRGRITDFGELEPEGWSQDADHERIPADKAIIYECHIRDMTMSEDSGVSHKGKFIGLAEKGTVNSYGMPTSIDYLKELGITHVHLLPVNDFATINEAADDGSQYDWGYNPQHFFSLEGSYSTNPFRGGVRVKEFKSLVKAIHDLGMNVVLDVVYNHTYRGTEGDLYRVFPGFYYRCDEHGNLTNGSGCGNELATERFMVRKFIVDSLLFWVKEYHVDGFRFDLMGLYDINTLEYVRKELDKIDPNIITYGEPWTGGVSPLDPDYSGIKRNISKLPKSIAAFSDDLRDAVKGNVFEGASRGYIHGNTDCRESVKFGIVGGCFHPSVNQAFLVRKDGFWAKSPMQSVNYVSCHDNFTLYDKLKCCDKDITENMARKLTKLCAAIVLTCQGIPFIGEGEEFLRSKDGDHNSYRSGDAVNALKWDNTKLHEDVVEYYKGLIKIRKKHPAFRMKEQEDVEKNIEFIDTENNNIITYIISGDANGDIWEKIAVIFNVGENSAKVQLPCGNWGVVADGNVAGDQIIKYIAGNIAEVPGKEAMILTIEKK